jgi:hypothetical protein
MKVDDTHRNETRRARRQIEVVVERTDGRTVRTDASLSLDSTRARDAVEFVTSSRPAVVVAVAVGGDDDVRGRGSRGAGCVTRAFRVSFAF